MGTLCWDHKLVAAAATIVEQADCELCRNAVEIERLKECEEFKLVAFLSRADVLVGLGEGPDLVVHHKHWKFEGRADNVISAARVAMLMEQKYLAAEAEREARETGLTSSEAAPLRQAIDEVNGESDAIRPE